MAQVKSEKAMKTCTKVDLMAKGFCESQAKRVIRQAKMEMVNRGCVFYAGVRVGRVPVWVVEELLGFNIETGEEVVF